MKYWCEYSPVPPVTMCMWVDIGEYIGYCLESQSRHSVQRVGETGIEKTPHGTLAHPTGLCIAHRVLVKFVPHNGFVTERVPAWLLLGGPISHHSKTSWKFCLFIVWSHQNTYSAYLFISILEIKISEGVTLIILIINGGSNLWDNNLVDSLSVLILTCSEILKCQLLVN